jgi:prepilin-type N-terminal cleavage/methylation domain-containing protein/prepilin-type processing-associated H-X9-DG protein
MKRKSAFTLIELLVVIAVIAVLMGILMPALKKAKEQAQSAVCQGNLKGYTLAVAMYAQDNADKFPDHRSCYFYTNDQLPGENVTGPNFRHQRWCNMQVNLARRPELAGEFFKYLVNVQSLICPTFKRLAKNKGVTVSADVQWDAMEDNSIYEPWHNYTMNAYLGPKEANSFVAKTMQTKDPSNVFVFADEGPYRVTGYNYQGLNDTSLWVIHPYTAASDAIRQYRNKLSIKPGPDNYGEFCDIVAGFHNAPSGDVTGGKGNCTFVDGHVAAISRDDSFSYAWPK